MRVAFYAPMKPPTSPVPSGDRQMARRLMSALEGAGHDVELAAVFAARDGDGDADRQARLKDIGDRLADRLVRRVRNRPPDRRPDVWFTYHLYHKAPDWIGPAATRALGIPYVVCEASYAPKQAGGKWALGHDAAGAAIRHADLVIGMNTADAPCVRPLLAAPDRLRQLRPFTDVDTFAAAADGRDRHHAALVETYDLDPQAPLLLAVGMMRPGDKLDSYRLLARAMALLDDEPWQLLVVGDGPARRDVEAAMAALGGDRVRFAGEHPADALAPFYAACDLLVWPAVREAYGVSLLEAQAAGLPVVAGDSGGVSDIVRDGRTGLLVPVGDDAAFADAVRALLQAPYYLADYSRAARDVTAREHSLAYAARELDAALAAVVGEKVP